MLNVIPPMIYAFLFDCPACGCALMAYDHAEDVTDDFPLRCGCGWIGSLGRTKAKNIFGIEIDHSSVTCVK